MGKCKYCGEDAGFLKSIHAECKARHDACCVRLHDLLISNFTTKKDFYIDQKLCAEIISNGHLSADDVRDIQCGCFDESIERYLDDGIIDNQEEQMVARFIQFTGLPQAVLNKNKSLEKVVQSKVLRSILNGDVPHPSITIGGDFPFLLPKTESLVWLFRNITLYEQKVRKEYRGRTQGMSFRIAKGVYYRTGGFKGSPFETTYMQRIGIGAVCLTDKCLYFSSPEKSLKVPYSKIISIESSSNGIGVQKDGATAKPIFLEGVNSWFAYNVIANLK